MYSTRVLCALPAALYYTCSWHSRAPVLGSQGAGFIISSPSGRWLASVHLLSLVRYTQGSGGLVVRWLRPPTSPLTPPTQYTVRPPKPPFFGNEGPCPAFREDTVFHSFFPQHVGGSCTETDRKLGRLQQANLGTVANPGLSPVCFPFDPRTRTLRSREALYSTRVGREFLATGPRLTAYRTKSGPCDPASPQAPASPLSR